MRGLTILAVSDYDDRQLNPLLFAGLDEAWGPHGVD